MQFYRKVAANTVFQIIARIFSSGSSFVITLLLARSLGINGYGDFAKITAFVSLFYFLSDFGLNAIFLQKEHPKGFAQLFQLRLFMSIIVIIGMNLVAFLLPYSPITGIGFSPMVKLGIMLFSLTIFSESLTNSATAIFQKKISYEFVMLGSFVGSIITVVTIWLALLFTHSLLVVLFCFVVGAMTESGIAFFLTKEKKVFVMLDVQFIKRLLQESLPIALMLFCNLLYFRIDMIILSLLRASGDVAVYDFAYKFFDFLIALPLFLSNSLYPSLLEEKNNQSQILRHVLIFFIVSLPIAIIAWLASPLIDFIKQDFHSSIFVLRILVISLPVFFITSITQWILIARKKQMFLLWVYAIALVINIIGNLAFIPHYSYIASAVLTDVGELFVALMLLIKIIWTK